MKVLNLYACLGGNRYKWNEVAKEAGIEIEVTAVELDPELACLYQDRFPNDMVIVADAHQYLIDNYKDFDFIWSSPPCPTHSRAAQGSRKSEKSKHKPVYPSMVLYEEVLLLQHYFQGKYVVENVIPYYQPLITGQKRGRHLYWSNFTLPAILTNRKVKIGTRKNEVEKLEKFHEIDVGKYKGDQRKCKIARNLVDYEAGRTIFETVLGIYKANNTNQLSIL